MTVTVTVTMLTGCREKRWCIGTYNECERKTPRATNAGIRVTGGCTRKGATESVPTVGFCMPLYGYVCSYCGRVFCKICHFNRKINV